MLQAPAYEPKVVQLATPSTADPQASILLSCFRPALNLHRERPHIAPTQAPRVPAGRLQALQHHDEPPACALAAERAMSLRTLSVLRRAAASLPSQARGCMC